MELVDTHCHLQFDKLNNRLDPVVGQAGKAGVTRMITVGTTLADSAKAVLIAEKLPNVWASAGVHPHDAENFADTDRQEELTKLLNKSSIVAVGEIGLDYYKDYCPREVQKQALHAQIKVGLKENLPFIFHVRDAWDDFWEVFDSYSDIRGVVHSFSAGPEQVEEILKRGLYIGLNGIMTFTNDPNQLEAAKQVPLDKLLLETDAPFLTPKPYRSETCEPKHVRTIAGFLAELRGEPLNKLAEATTANAVSLFGLKT